MTGAESFESLERTKQADVTDEDVTDEAKVGDKRCQKMLQECISENLEHDSE